MKWETTMIGERCLVTSSKRCHLSERSSSGVPFYCSKEIIQLNGGLEVTAADYIAESLYKDIEQKYGVPQPGDLLVTTRGTNGIPYIYRDNDRFYFADGNLTWLKGFKQSLHPKYLFYWFLSPNGKSKVDSISKGTAQKAVPIAGIKALTLKLPPIAAQRRIADVLSAYDDLIENNRKQIKLLEEAAQRLYKEWFVDLRFPGWETTPVVDGLPEGWKKCYLNDAILFNPTTKVRKDTIKKSVPMSSLSTSSMEIDESQITFTRSTAGAKFLNGDTLLARITPCLENGKTAFVSSLDDGEVAVGSTEFIVMRSKSLNPYMVYCIARSDDFRQIAINSMTGADGRQRVKTDKIEVIGYQHPTQVLIDACDEKLKPIFDYIGLLDKGILQAQQARDALLPKLMNGEIEV